MVIPVRAEPTPTIVEPASMNSLTSAALLTPPQPTIGTSVTAAISRMHLRAIGKTPLPDMPPAPLLSTGCPYDDVYPGPTVLIAHRASAPPSTAARAISPILEVFGVNLGITGILTTAFTAAVTSLTISGSCPMAIP